MTTTVQVQSPREGGLNRSGKFDWKAPALIRTEIILVLVLLWQAAAFFGLANEKFTSSPYRIVLALAQLFQDPVFYTALLQTLYSVLIAFIIGAIAGMLIGIALGISNLLREAFLPIVMVIMGLPKSVFLPLMILFFGFGVELGIAFGAFLSVFHVIVNVVAGIDLVDKKYFDVAKAYDASNLSKFFYVILPGATPGIFAGIWHGIRNSFVGVVIAQMFISNIGIGYLVRLYSNNFQADRALAVVIFAAVLVVAAGNTWSIVERKLTSWKSE